MNKTNKCRLLKQQLEFYFSSRNLVRDTYLQTLLQRNDGGVPLTIVADFDRIRAICLAGNPQVRLEMLMEAVNMSQSLTIIHVDVDGIERVRSVDHHQGFQGRLVPCVATHNKQPLPDQPTSSVESPCNVMILRDLPPDTTEDEIRALVANIPNAPPVRLVQRDTTNCWYVMLVLVDQSTWYCLSYLTFCPRFVTLSTDERAVMIAVLQQVQKACIRDCPVHARLKASPSIDVLPVLPRRKKKSRGLKKSQKKKEAAGSSSSSKTSRAVLTDQDFPSLKTVEWAASFAESQEAASPTMPKSSSDTGSTATTTSTSTDSVVRYTGKGDDKTNSKPISFADVIRRGP